MAETAPPQGSFELATLQLLRDRAREQNNYRLHYALNIAITELIGGPDRPGGLRDQALEFYADARRDALRQHRVEAA